MGWGEPSLPIRPENPDKGACGRAPWLSLVPYKMCPTARHKHTRDGALEVSLLDFWCVTVDSCWRWHHRWLHTRAYLQTYQKQELSKFPSKPLVQEVGISDLQGPACLNRLLICLGKAGKLGRERREGWGCALSGVSCHLWL